MDDLQQYVTSLSRMSTTQLVAEWGRLTLAISMINTLLPGMGVASTDPIAERVQALARESLKRGTQFPMDRSHLRSVARTWS